MKNLLYMRFVLLNFLTVLCFGAAWKYGIFDMVQGADTTNISYAIFFVWLGGIIMAVNGIIRIGQMLDAPNSTEPFKAVERRLDARVAPIEWLTNALIGMGFFGTVVGFLISLQGLELADAGDVTKVGPMIQQVTHGMGIALYTTAVGLVLSLVLGVYIRMLEGAHERYLTRLERHA